MTTVSVEQDDDSGVLTIQALLGDSSKRLAPGFAVDFEVSDGTRYITLTIVSSSASRKDFRLDFTNAERPDGSSFLEDTGYNSYRGRFRLHVPEV